MASVVAKCVKKARKCNPPQSPGNFYFKKQTRSESWEHCSLHMSCQEVELDTADGLSIKQFFFPTHSVFSTFFMNHQIPSPQTPKEDRIYRLSGCGAASLPLPVLVSIILLCTSLFLLSLPSLSEVFHICEQRRAVRAALAAAARPCGSNGVPAAQLLRDGAAAGPAAPFLSGVSGRVKPLI